MSKNKSLNEQKLQSQREIRIDMMNQSNNNQEIIKNSEENINLKIQIKRFQTKIENDLINLKNEIIKISDQHFLVKCVDSLKEIISSVNYQNLKFDHENYKDIIKLNLQEIYNNNDVHIGKRYYQSKHIIDAKYSLNGQNIKVKGYITNKGGSWYLDQNWCDILICNGGDGVGDYDYCIDTLKVDYLTDFLNKMGFKEPKYQYLILRKLYDETGNNDSDYQYLIDWKRIKNKIDNFLNIISNNSDEYEYEYEDDE